MSTVSTGGWAGAHIVSTRMSEDPLIEEENKQERVIKMSNRIIQQEVDRKDWQEQLKIDRLPYWLHPDADYSPWDAGMWPEEYEED